METQGVLSGKNMSLKETADLTTLKLPTLRFLDLFWPTSTIQWKTKDNSSLTILLRKINAKFKKNHLQNPNSKV